MADASFSNDSFLINGPSFHVDLASLDARHPVHYSRRLLLFRCASSAQRAAQLAALKIGLQALVARCPILGGIVVPLPPDKTRHGLEDWRTVEPGKGVELIVRDLRTQIASFSELEADHFPAESLPYELLVPIPLDIGNDRPFAACKVQFSAIEGGTIITWAMSHSVADGAGNNELFRILSEETRFAQVPSGKVTVSENSPKTVTTGIGLDRSIMHNITSEVPFKIEDHPAYTWNTTISSDQAPHHPFEATSPEVSVSFRISPIGLAKLKADATTLTLNAPPISTHDAIVALIWRSILLIRSRRAAPMPRSTIGHIFFPSDARRQLNLPPSYMGNAVYQLTASLDIDTLFSTSGLSQAASAVRAAIKAATPEAVGSLLAKTNERWIDWAFLSKYSTTGVAMGTDWTSGMLYTQDWGEAFGPLVRYRYPGVGGEVGGCCILPKLVDGGAEVDVGVMPEEVEILRGLECFGAYTDAR